MEMIGDMATIGGIITITGMLTGHILGCMARQDWAITRPRLRVISRGRRWTITAIRRGRCPDMITGSAGDWRLAGSQTIDCFDSGLEITAICIWGWLALPSIWLQSAKTRRSE